MYNLDRSWLVYQEFACLSTERNLSCFKTDFMYRKSVLLCLFHCSFEYHGKERTSLEEGVGVVRKEIEGMLEVTRSARERVVTIYETGKAHSMGNFLLLLLKFSLLCMLIKILHILILLYICS